MKKNMRSTSMRTIGRSIGMFALMIATVMAQSFTPTGGTVNSGYWNASNTGGTFSFVIPNDNTIVFLAMNIEVNDDGNYAEIGAQEFGVSAQQSKTYTRTATEIETAGSFSDGDTYDIHVIFYKTSGGIAAVDTLTLANDIEVDQTAPAAFQVGAVTTLGGNVTAGYWNDTNTDLRVTIPIANDLSLQGGSVQITGFVGGNPAEDLGSAANVLIINTTQNVNLDDTDFVNKVWFLDEQTFSLSATLFDAAGNSTSGTASLTTLSIDQTAPSISAITSTSADDTYGVGESINITVTYDEAVTLSGGDLFMDLNTGSQQTISTINNSTTFSSTYTVAEGDEAASLNVDLFSFSGGAVKLLDAAGNNADINTITSNLEDNTDIVVEGSTPTVSTISTTATGSYGVGDELEIQVEFSEALTLSGGNLLVTLDASGTDVVISPFSSSTTATGTYTVANGDQSSALTVTSLSLSGGTLLDAGGNSVDLSLVGVTNIDDVKTVAIDGAAPAAFTVSTVTVTGGDVVAGYWNATNTGLSVVVPVANDASLNGGTVQIQGFLGDISGAEDMGSTSALNGSHLGGSITVALTSAEIEALTGFTDAATLKITAILADAGGNSTQGTQSANTFSIDQTSPVVSSISSSTADDTYGIGDAVNITIAFSENVTISGGNLLTTLNTGKQLSSSDISGTNSLSQTYTISALEETTDLTVSTLALSGGSVDLVDAAGNPVDLSLPASNLGTTSAIEIDGIVPTLSSITSSSPDGSYGVDDVINIRVTFSEEVTLSGGNLEVTHDASATEVLITSINNALFGEANYTVADGDASSDLMVTALALSAGTLQDAGGNDVDLSSLVGLTNIDDGSDIIVDGASPDAFTVGTVTVTGGDVVSGYWNSTNTGMTILVPIAEDNGLVGGTVQLQGFFNAIGGAVNVGDPVTIAGGNLGGNRTMTLTAVQIEAIPGFDEDEVLKITAVITDDGGNSTTGTQSANTFTIDQTAPQLISVTSTTANGTHGVGDDVNITFNFDENVTLSGGNFVSTLSTGTEVSTNSVNDESSVSQTYTVAENDEDTDLDVSDLELSVGTASLVDAAGNEAVLTLPVGNNLADNSALVIDGIYPTLTSISSTSANGRYGVGRTINITLNFSEAVTLAGGNLEVDIDASATDVLITSISNSTTGSKTYTVAVGDDSEDLTVDALSLSAGSLRDAGGNDVDLSDLTGISNISDTRNIVVDGDAPAAFQVGNVVTTGGVVVADYWNDVNTGVNVTVPIANDASLQNGKVLILGRVGANPFEAVGDSSSILAVNTNKTVPLSQTAIESITGYEDGAVLSFSALIRDDVYNQTTGTASATTLTIDETAPSIASITSLPASGILGVGESTDVTVTFSESVTLGGSGSVSVTLETGATDATLTESDISGATSFVETYTVSEDDESADLTVSSITLNSGTLRDVAGNNATFALPSGNNLADNSAIAIDGIIPSITAITSTSADGDYALGDQINITVTFSEELTLQGGNLLVTLETGDTDRQVSIAPFSDSDEVTATYTVQAGDESNDLTVSAIALSAGTLQDAASNDAVMTVPSGANNLAGSSDILVDGTAPADFTVGTVVTTGGVVKAGYWNDSNLGITVTVPIDNDASLQTGRLQILARIGANAYENLGADAEITSVGVNKAMNFTWSLVEAISGYDEGAVIQIAAIITDDIGNATTGSPSATTLTVDTVDPSIASVTSIPVGSTLAVGESADITITFSEAVTLANGNFRTTLATGGTGTILTTSTIANTNTVTETYTVAEDETSSDLNITGFSLSAGTLRDAAGNNIDLALPVGNNLADNSSLVVDGLIPTVTRIQSSLASDILGLGETLTVDVQFSEAVTLSGGDLVLTFDNGQTASITAFAADDEPSGIYTVQVGDESTDLNVTGLALSGGSLVDGAGNNVDLSLPSGNNLADNNDIVVDGIVPGAFTTGDILTLGAPVVTGYWNEDNTDFQVIIPVTGLDASMNGGTAQLQARMNANAFANLGASYAVTTNPVTVTITEAQLEAGLAGFLAGGTIQVRGVLTDIAGNETIGSISNVELIIDETDPATPTTGTLLVAGGTANQGFWNQTNATLTINTPLANDATLIGGTLQIQMSIDGGAYNDIGTDSTLTTANTTHQTVLSAASLTAAGISEGNELSFIAVLTDIAGNETTGLPGANSIQVDTNIPTVDRIQSAVASDILGLSETLIVDVRFTEPVTLSGGNLVLTFDTGQTASISPFTLTTEPSAVYTVQVGDESLDLTVTGLALSAGTLQDEAGNTVDLSLPSGNNLGDNNAIVADGIVPGAFTTGDILTIGAPVVTGYWNEDNTDFQVVIPVTGLDASMNGGTAQLQARMNANAFANIGSSYPVTTNPVTVTITEAQMIADLAGFLAGGTIQVRGVLTDVAGNATIGSTSNVELIIDEIDPASTGPVTMAVSGGIIVDNQHWNSTNTQVTIGVSIANDPSLDGGRIQMQADVDGSGSFNDLGNDSTIVNIDAIHSISLSPTDLTTFGAIDGDVLAFRPVLTDVAGNVTIGTSNYSLEIDYTNPADFQVGTVTSIENSVVAGYFNSTNSGMDITIPIDVSDNTLIGGNVQLRASVDGAAAESILLPVDIDALSDITISATRGDIEGIPGYAEDVSLSFDAIITDAAGNATLGSASADAQLIDQTLPVNYPSIDIRATGGNSYAGYWNSTNTGVRVKVPLTNDGSLSTDGSLIGGVLSVRGDLTPPGNNTFETFATTFTIPDLSSDTISVTIPAAEVEALNGGGFGNGLEILFRTTITDIAGNSATSATSAVELLIDQAVPAAPDITDMIIRGTNVVDGVWSSGADSLIIALPISDPDVSLPGGYVQIEMSVGSTFDENPYELVVPTQFTIPMAVDTIRLASEDISGLSDFADGLTLFTRVLVRDISGNETIGSTSAEEILIDVNPPAHFTSGALVATGGTVEENAYNNSNTGIQLDVPLVADPSLIGGSAILKVSLTDLATDPFVPNPFENIDTVLISADNTTLQLTANLALLSSLAGYRPNHLMIVTAGLTDYAGNEVEGTPSSNQLVLDFLAPDIPVINDTTTTGGNVVANYWNASNDGIAVTVETQAQPGVGDTTLLDDGYFQVQGRYGFETAWVNLGSQVIIDSPNLTERTSLIPASEIEALPGFTDGFAIDLRILMVDGHGNDTLGAPINDWLLVDQIDPVAGNFIAGSTSAQPFINAVDTLMASWENFSDAHAGLNGYEFSMGSTPEATDVADWRAYSSTSLDTIFTYTHGASYFMNIRALDLAGNQSDIISSTEFVTDLIRPLSSIDMEPYYLIDDWTDSLKGFYSDELSGVDSIHLNVTRSSDGFYWNGSAWAADSVDLDVSFADSAWSYILDEANLENRIDYSLRLVAIDSAGNVQTPAVTHAFQFVINTPPVMADIPGGSVDEDSLFSYAFAATDVDLGSISGDTLRYTLLEGPDSMRVTTDLTNNSGEVSWTPTNADVGLHQIRIGVTDDYGEMDSTQFLLVVLQVNDPPEPVTLLSLPNATQITADSMEITFTWTNAFDIEGDNVDYIITFYQAADPDAGTVEYESILTSDTNYVTLDVSEMDFPYDSTEWFVVAHDQLDSLSDESERFTFHTSPAAPSLNTTAITLQMDRYTFADTSVTLGNLGLTDLRWSLHETPVWVELSEESGTVEFDDSTSIGLTFDNNAFTVGTYEGVVRLVYNDLTPDTLDIMVTVNIYDKPTPVLAFYRNPAFPGHYQLMIVDSLGMVDTLLVMQGADTLEVAEVGSDAYSFLVPVEFTSEGNKSFQVYASNWTGDTTITATVTVSLLKPSARWLARSPDQDFEIEGSSGSVLRKTQLTVLDSLLSAGKDARYSVLADGVELAEPVLVSMPDVTGMQAIYLQDAIGEFMELPSISDGERVSAWTAELGDFQLGPRTIVVPERSKLAQNYPNPFNPSTTIEFDVGFLDGLNQDIQFGIYNIRGQEVKQLLNTQMQPGSYAISWNGLDDTGRQVSSGIYFARLMTGKGYVKTVKMLVLR
jgi:hypothetical protein